MPSDTDARGVQHDARAERALTDVVAVESLGPGMARVTTWSDSYVIDARGDGCDCPDSQYNLEGGMCKHHIAALVATSDRYPDPYIHESLDERNGQTTVLA